MLEYSLVLPDVSIELNVNGDVMSGKLPGIEIEPVIRYLNLITIDDLLFEDTIFIAQAVPPSRVI